MPLDRWPWICVACWVGIGACGPAVPPVAPPPEPGAAEAPPAATTPVESPAAVRPGRRILLGEVCPQSAGGRPALAPLLLRGVQWTDEDEELASAISHGQASRFVVFGADGKRAGTFDALGLADGAARAMALGSYTGAPPCSKAGAGSARVEDTQCQSATSGCGLAVALLGDAVEPLEAKPGGVCQSGDALVVDLDGDGVSEAFAVAGLLDGVRGPAEQLEARTGGAAACSAQFSLWGVRQVAEAGKPVDPRYVVTIDVLAVIDLDDDGRRELILALRYPDQRTIAVFGVAEVATQLRLLGESSSLAR